jgi:hypothetical protein
MKIQCSCGAKYEFAVSPEMLNRPFKFVCSACGLDASEYVLQLVRQELGNSGAQVPGATGQAPAGILLDEPGSAAKPDKGDASEPKRATAKVQARIHQPEPAAADAITPAGTPCHRHPGELAFEKCFVCGKPICPKCMELFGWVCSPLCKAKAESHGIAVPVFEGQKSVVEARLWRRVGRLGMVLGGILVLLIGFWIWYRWFGSVPKPVFSVRFAEPSYSGQSAFAGANNDQIVFLHGNTLARYQLKPKKEVWSRDLLDRKELAEQVAARIKSLQELNFRLRDQGDTDGVKIPSPETLTRRMEKDAAAQRQLYVRGTNIWVEAPGKLVLHDWTTGAPLKEIPIQAGFGGLISRGNELLFVSAGVQGPQVTAVDLTTSQSRTELLTGEAARVAAAAVAAATNRSGRESLAGLPLVPGRDGGRAMDPAKVAEEAQRLSLPARIALPALLSSSMTQERALAEMNDQARRSASGAAGAQLEGAISLIPTRDGFFQMSVRLVESRLVERNAMKAAPTQSALEGAVSVANTLEVANEILNEMQRSRGGGTVIENLSRYRVTVGRPGDENPWIGEVVGPPTLYPLQTVNVLGAGKTIHVLDKSNRKLWTSELSYKLSSDTDALDPEGAAYGQGPCVEHKGSLYVFDEGVLSAFDLKTGSVRWRLPSVGIAGLFFDEADALYVNTTTASPESIKFSRQIDLSQKVSAVVLKVDARDGKVLWSVEPGGLVNYVSGDFVYTVRFYMPPEPDEDEFPTTETGFETPPYLRIRRINPANGTVMWEYFQQRAPLDIQFDRNTIRLVFKKEVQVLRFLSL